MRKGFWTLYQQYIADNAFKLRDVPPSSGQLYTVHFHNNQFELLRETGIVDDNLKIILELMAFMCKAIRAPKTSGPFVITSVKARLEAETFKSDSKKKKKMWITGWPLVLQSMKIHFQSLDVIAGSNFWM